MSSTSFANVFAVLFLPSRNRWIILNRIGCKIASNLFNRNHLFIIVYNHIIINDNNCKRDNKNLDICTKNETMYLIFRIYSTVVIRVFCDREMGDGC